MPAVLGCHSPQTKVMAQNWNPINDLLFLQERMNRLFEDATQRRSGTEEDDIRRDQEIERADWVPAADIVEREGQYVISLDLPGIDRQSLDISVEKDRLLIRGTRTLDGESRRRSERPQGRFVRRFGLPSQIDQGNISAEYHDGVLKITIPKRPEPQAKRVEIKVS